MRALLLDTLGPMQAESRPLRMADLPIPVPKEREVLIRIAACGVCHTELDEIEGRTARSRLPMVLGHQVVGFVESIGNLVTDCVVGERVGVAWVFSACGTCTLVLKLVRHSMPATRIFVFARNAKEREFAMELGAAWAGDTCDQAPVLLDAIIDTTPAWLPVMRALENLVSGGRLVINAIRKESRDQSELRKLDYPKHLWLEKEIKSVANVTRQDVREFLWQAAKASIKPQVRVFPLADANVALVELKTQSVIGAKVLRSISAGSTPSVHFLLST